MNTCRAREDAPSRGPARQFMTALGVVALTLATLVGASALSAPTSAIGVRTDDSSPSPTTSVAPSPLISPAAEPVPVGHIDPATLSLVTVAGSAVTPTVGFTAPALTGTLVYTVSPELPIGLALDAISGAISGTPVYAQAAADYTVTGTSESGSATGQVSIAVTPVVAPATFTVLAERRTPLTPTSGLFAIGFNGPVAFSTSPALPQGLKLDSRNGSISGTPTTALLPMTSTITATDGTFSATSQVTISVSCGTGQGVAPTCRMVPLTKSGANPNAAAGFSLLASTPDNIHGPFTTTTDSCAACHRNHSDPATEWAPEVDPVATLCFTCHDGTGASPNVYTEYYAGTNPAGTPRYTNVAATRSIYTHDALVATNHVGPTVDSEGTSYIVNEFQNTLNRHAECTDCHNPHDATTAASTQTSAGWTVSGRTHAAAGVSVVNGAAGATPTYTLLGAKATPMTLEYQLCFKCHSGYTTLPSNTGFPSSQWYLDKGVELNPANLSTHPIEGVGSNSTAAMTASLAGTSPYKLWTFTTGSTIRCTNCHAGGTITAAGGAGQNSQPHAAANRGILLLPYRDRVLRSTAAPNYAAADFALCYGCHTDIPFKQQSATATNFADHGLHVSSMTGSGSGGASTNIDTAGAGAGTALCAECHYRLHSTQTMLGSQTLSGTRLVNFAPNIQPVSVAGVPTIKWSSTSTGHGSCTLLCHGKTHTNMSY